MNLDIKLHKHDLPDQLKLGNIIAVDCEMGGLNFRRDPLFYFNKKEDYWDTLTLVKT